VADFFPGETVWTLCSATANGTEHQISFVGEYRGGSYRGVYNCDETVRQSFTDINGLFTVIGVNCEKEAVSVSAHAPHRSRGRAEAPVPHQRSL
jgi:hypothetical protein